MSAMSMDDLWGMCDHALAQSSLYRFWTTRSGLSGTRHWRGIPGGWAEQGGDVVMCSNYLNATLPQYQRACPQCKGKAE